MPAPNHNGVFRPLCGGIAILNPLVGQLGTLGCIATSDRVDRWIVSCYHVLCRPQGGPFADGEPIYQPTSRLDPVIVARTSRQRAAVDLDCAAAFVAVGVPTDSHILGLGQLAQPAPPIAGQRVLKSGRATGVTEGELVRVVGDRVEIRVPQGFPSTYQLTEPGDSGAIWVDKDTCAPVALHTGGNDAGLEVAYGVSLQSVFARLGLQLV